MDAENSVLNISNWELVDPKTVILLKLEERTEKHICSAWVNDGSISPLDLYCYLKARFGAPNGLAMLFRNPSTDNLIQWHYTLCSGDFMIDFCGMNRRLEILVKGTHAISKEDWAVLLTQIKADFTNFGSQMSKVRQSLEKWSLFVNPYKRLNDIVETFVKRLEALDLKKPTLLPRIVTRDQVKRYLEEFSKWHQNILEAKIIGTSLRMIVPVLAESFVNLIIFILAKQDVKSDVRLYEELVRKQIDIRVKSLHLYCDGFIKNVESNSEEFKKFHTLMNSRNDFLHGNVDPIKLKFDEVFFDNKTIPLFRDERSLSDRLIGNSIRHIEPEVVLNEVKVVRDFVTFVLGHLDPKVRKDVEVLMAASQPGLREDTKTVGVLFSGAIGEFIPITKGQ